MGVDSGVRASVLQPASVQQASFRSSVRCLTHAECASVHSDESSVASSALQSQLTKVSPCPFILEDSYCTSDDNCRCSHFSWSGSKDFYIVASVCEGPVSWIADPAGSLDAEDTWASDDFSGDSDNSVTSPAPPIPTAIFATDEDLGLLPPSLSATGVDNGVGALVQFHGCSQPPSYQHPGVHDNLCINCLQGKCRHGMCNLLLQGSMESGLSPVPAASRELANPHPRGKGPVFAVEEPSAPIAPGPANDESPQNRLAEDARADDFYLVGELEGFQKPIMGIALPSGTNKLFVCSTDTVKILDGGSGQCIWMENITDMVKTDDQRYRFSSLTGVEAWVFFSFPGVLKAWDYQTGAHLALEIPGSRNRAYAIVLGTVNGDQFLFAGLQEGSILVWKWKAACKVFETAVSASASLAGAHSLAIRSLVLQGERLYSGSMDSTIKVWDLANLHNPHFLARLKCLQILNGHNDCVTSILCWNQFLLSGSLDGTVRMWAPTANIDSFQMEQVYVHKDADGVVALSLMNGAKSSPVLLCSCNNFTVYLYHLPSFVERGHIFSRGELRQMVEGPEGLFFTGDMSGELKLWKWAGNQN